MDTTDKGHTGRNRTHKPAPATEEKYREAVELYASTDLTCVEISRRCSVSLAGFKGYICKYRRDLLLPRYGATRKRLPVSEWASAGVSDPPPGPNTARR